jgi:hypothetical protein
LKKSLVLAGLEVREVNLDDNIGVKANNFLYLGVLWLVPTEGRDIKDWKPVATRKVDWHEKPEGGASVNTEKAVKTG